MGLRFRKSMKIAPGVRLHVGKKSASVSVGGKGLRYSVNTNGRKTTTVGIPGSGLYYTKQHKTNSYKRHDELAKRQREAEKLEQIERNKLEVELFENRLDMLKSIHIEADEEVNWKEIRKTPPPFQPGSIGPKEAQAKAALDNYKPGFWEKLFKRDEKKRQELQQKVTEARKADTEDYQAWEELVQTADKILAGDIDTYFQVIEEFAPLDDLLEFGSGFEFFADEPHVMEVHFDVHSDTVLPTKTKSLTKTGKVSVRDFPKMKRLDLQQDYVCSCTIRIARDMFALLPLDYIYINAIDEQLNTTTGHTERNVILSVKIDRDTLNKLNLENIDCSDAMENFEHHMDFKKRTGFQPVEPLLS